MDKKVVFCITGGYYYNWARGSHFYDWLYDFTNKNDNFDVVVMSWRKKEDVPSELLDRFKFIFRDNNGCDWGCYDDFLKWYKSSNEEYDYMIFCHDDISSEMFDWPTKMIKHMESNQQFDLTSLVGRYMKVPPQVCRDKNPEFVKEFLSMCFCMRVTDFLLENNPFVTIPGHEQDVAGDTGCNVVAANIWNIWGSDKIGWACFDGKDTDPALVNAVGHYKRGRTNREFKMPTEYKELCNTSLKQALDAGWIIEPGKMAKNKKLGYV